MSNDEKKPAPRALSDIALYGRDKAISTIQQAFLDSQTGAQVLLVQGNRGSGKTALVTKAIEAAISTEQKKSYFVRGRYDEIASAQPFSGLVDALSDLCDNIFEDNQRNKRQEQIRIKLIDAVGSDATILTYVLPGLSKLMGETASSTNIAIKCKPEWTFERLKISIRSFLQAICGCNIPVVLFLDDLHYADEGSVELLKYLAVETTAKNFLFVGACCDEQMTGSVDPLITDITKYAGTNPESTKIVELQNLSLAEVRTLLSDLSKEQLSNSDDFAAFLHAKTNGSPHFLVLLLQTLLVSRFRRISPESESWEWDLDKIKRECIYGALLEIIVDKVNKSLAEGVREVLTICACIGSHFSLSTLDMTVNTKARQLKVVEALQEATLAGLLREDPVRGYRFASDDIRRIIYEQVSEESGRALLHLSIGYQLNARLEVEKKPDPNIVLLINRQLNMGSGMVTESKGRMEIAKINVTATKIAKQKAAFRYALECLQASWDLISKEPNKWEQNYSLCIEVAELFVELLYTTKDFESCLLWTSELLRYAQSPEDKLEAFRYRVYALAAQGYMNQALGAALQFLEELGERVPSDPPFWLLKKELATTSFMLRKRKDETLLALPMKSSRKGATILSLMWSVADCCASSSTLNRKLLDLASVRQMKVALREGLASAYTFSLLGRVMGSHRYTADACRFGNISLHRMDVCTPSDHVATLATTTVFLSHLQSPWQKCVDPLLEAHRIGVNFGEAHFGSVAALSAVEVAIYAGLPLQVINDIIKRTSSDVERFGRAETISRFNLCKQFVLNLSGESVDPLLLSGSAMKEVEFLTDATGYLLQQFHLFKLILSVYFKDEASMESASNELLEEGIYDEDTHISSLPRLFFLALAAYRLGRIRVERRYQWRAKRVTKELEKLTKRDDVSAVHFLDILNAEKASFRNRASYDVKRAYDDAIEASASSGFVSHAALTNELAGEHFDRQKDLKMAHLYISKSENDYRSWGAIAKV